MSQYDPKHPTKKKITSFNSRTLSEVERRYSQTEKEALGLVWACEKLHLYLVGRDFDVITDNKAVELIFNNPYSTPKARIERWCLRLMPFHFKVIHKPGNENIADFLSRNPLKAKTIDDNETIAELYINTITNASVPSAISIDKLIQETNKDGTLLEVKKLILNEKFNEKVPYFSNYNRIKDELSIASNGLLLKNTKIIIPTNLQHQIISIAHNGHQGIVQTKQLIRAHVWVPNIDSLVEQEVKSFLKCQINTDTTRLNPLVMSEMTNGPWESTAVDFFGPLPSGIYLLVLIDLYSRYPIVKKIRSTAAKSVIPTLDDIFAHYGIPMKLKSDNGPPFKSLEFKDFMELLGIIHARITPNWPRANAVVEKFMQCLNKVIKINGLVNKNWEADLNEFLRNYRATPNSTTKVAPIHLLFQTNSTTSRLPMMRSIKFDTNQHLLAKTNDAKSKAIMKANADFKLRTQHHSFKVNDTVLLKQKKVNKQTPLFDPKPFRIVEIKGTMITIERDGVRYARNSSLLKSFNLNQSNQHKPIDQVPIKAPAHSATKEKEPVKAQRFSVRLRTRHEINNSNETPPPTPFITANHQNLSQILVQQASTDQTTNNIHQNNNAESTIVEQRPTNSTETFTIINPVVLTEQLPVLTEQPLENQDPINDDQNIEFLFDQPNPLVDYSNSTLDNSNHNNLSPETNRSLVQEDPLDTLEDSIIIAESNENESDEEESNEYESDDNELNDTKVYESNNQQQLNNTFDVPIDESMYASATENETTLLEPPAFKRERKQTTFFGKPVASDQRKYKNKK